MAHDWTVRAIIVSLVILSNLSMLSAFAAAESTYPWLLALERNGRWEVVPSLIRDKATCESMGRSSLDPDGVSPADQAVCIQYVPRMTLGFYTGSGKYVALSSMLTGSQVTR